MKKSRFTDSQIMVILKQHEDGIAVTDLCREHNISNSTFYKWRERYGGMDTSMMKRMKELEDENRRLKKMHAEEKLTAEIAREAIEKKWQGHFTVMRWQSEYTRSEMSAFVLRASHLVLAKAVITSRLSFRLRTWK